MDDSGVDSDLELGIALSVSEQVANDSEKPIIKIARRKLLPPVVVSNRSKKLLRNVYLRDHAAKEKIDAVIDKAFQTLRAIGDSDDTNETTISVEAMGVALKRLGYAVDRPQLQEMLACYGEGRSATASKLADLVLQMREVVDDLNVQSEWRPKGAKATNCVESIDIDTFRQIFLDCHLRIETNGLIY